MSILTLQRRMRELGRIRTGQQVASGNGRKRPAKLETFRLTSDSKPLIEAAAEAFGGEVRPWESPAGPEWEVITQADALDIVVPPGQAVGQWYELWAGGGCQRRCDGEREVLTDSACICAREFPDLPKRIEAQGKGEACKPTTRLNVILPGIPDLGVWRLESHGFYAAVELAGAAEFLEAATASGRLLPARLRLDQRTVKRPGKQPQHFAVPVIEFTQTRISDLVASGALRLVGDGGEVDATALGAPPVRPALPPGPGLPEASDFRAAESRDEAPTEMTREELVAELERLHVAPEYAITVARQAVTGFDGSRQLTPAERVVLWRALVAEQEDAEAADPAAAL